MNRLDALTKFASGYRGAKLVAKLKKDQHQEILDFIKSKDHLGHLEFEYAVNRLYLDREKQKGWVDVTEILLSINTRVKSS